MTGACSNPAAAGNADLLNLTSITCCPIAANREGPSDDHRSALPCVTWYHVDAIVVIHNACYGVEDAWCSYSSAGEPFGEGASDVIEDEWTRMNLPMRWSIYKGERR